jgi:uncharacterized protein YjbI with pentapeptide repeats
MNIELSEMRRLIQQLRSFDNKQVLNAVDELRKHGWLHDRSLNGLDLRHVHLKTADLSGASLLHVDLSMADMRWTDLRGADLKNAQLNHTLLYRSKMKVVRLSGANLIRANLQSASNLSENELAKANALYGATMPDGSIYNGRFDLPGDLEIAQSRGVDPGDEKAMADFYGVSVLNHWSHNGVVGLPHCTYALLLRKLRSFNNNIVAHAVEELRRRGRLSDGSLRRLDLRFAHLHGIDLSAADLTRVNLSQADMRGVNLAYTHLESARFHKVNFRGANFEKADLRDATFTDAILQGTHHLSDEQLAQASRLRGAMMPDGSQYDGRFNLLGDITDAYAFKIDIENPESLANYFGISLEDYLIGQSWIHDHLPAIWARKEHLHIADVLFALNHPDKSSTSEHQPMWR